MIKNVLRLLLVLSFQFIDAQITLTHNVGNNPVKTDITSCDYEEYWARTFTLSDFGISTDDQFIIKSAQIAISNSYNGAQLIFNIYSIDSNFPNSTPKRISYGNLGYAPFIGDSPEIVQVDFSTPIVIPAGVERILVEVTQGEDIYNPDYTQILIAGTKQDNDTSWFKGCRELYTYTPTENLSTPMPNANFFINVTGETFSTSNFGSTTTLTHNICDDLIKPRSYGCSYGGMSWSRDFILEDFGISNNEEFVINSGQVALYYANWGVDIKFNIYKIDDNFPASFSETDLIGSSQVVPVSYISSNTSSAPKIIDVQFETPIIVPNNISRILVEVYQGGSAAFPAGTVQDNGVSWIKSYSGGCTPFGEFVDTRTIAYPDARFYINVSGDINHVTNNFEMNISNICSEFLKEFSVEKKSDIASIVWNFGDPASGVDNTSTDLSPYHDFSKDGTYTITAKVTAKSGNVEVLTETINVKEPPNAYGINNIEACEDTFGTGISTSFNTSNIQSQILGGQSDTFVTYIDGSGNEYDLLPNPFKNTIKDRETITVRVARNDELCCYSEITFDLIVNALPDISNIEDVFTCDDNDDGFTAFDLTQIQSDLSANNINVDFYFQDGQQIPNAQLDAVINKVQNQEVITVKVIDTQTNCYNETTFKLIVNPLPIANQLLEIIGCDDNGDGISEYFDTSNVETEVLNGQTGMEVSYFNGLGNQLSSPLPNPYTNTKANQETITLRVTNPQTGCYSETLLTLITSSKPQINQLAPLFACDEGNGYATFDLSDIPRQLIGNQTGLNIIFIDEEGNSIPLPKSHKNTKPWSHVFVLRVEDENNPYCYSEINIELIVNSLPQINLENEYFLCDLEPSLNISTDSTFDSWEWSFEDGSVISNTFDANLTDAGIYTLWVYKIIDGISCENSFSFNLIRSVLPKIVEVKIQDISDNNYIEIITSGDGDFEYSIDGLNFQNDNTFHNLLGGIYNVQVRDKKGCGSDIKELVLVDYPKFFTPNNDGYNDYWQIQGVEKFPNAIIYIFDRFGKLLHNLTANDLGWDGTYNGKSMFASDYWFSADLGDGRNFKGHFSLIR